MGAVGRPASVRWNIDPVALTTACRFRKLIPPRLQAAYPVMASVPGTACSGFRVIRSHE